MKIHPRRVIVARAATEIAQAVVDVTEKHGLTVAEVLTVLVGEMQEYTKYVLRIDRHGTTDKKADEE